MSPKPHHPDPAALKYRLPVRLALTGGDRVDGQVWLARTAEYRLGRQTLLERLNEHWRVLPVATHERVRLVNRDDLEWVEAGQGVDDTLVGPNTVRVTHEEEAVILLRSGVRIQGVIAMEMPEGYNRTSDFVSGDEDFFTLRSGDRTLLVNKLRVREIQLSYRNAGV